MHLGCPLGTPTIVDDILIRRNDDSLRICSAHFIIYKGSKMIQRSLFSLPVLLIIGLSTWTSATVAEETDVDATSQKDASKVVTFTTQEDHQHMQEQLGITKLRPGPSGNPDAPKRSESSVDRCLACRCRRRFPSNAGSPLHRGSSRTRTGS